LLFLLLLIKIPAIRLVPNPDSILVLLEECLQKSYQAGDLTSRRGEFTSSNLRTIPPIVKAILEYEDKLRFPPCLRRSGYAQKGTRFFPTSLPIGRQACPIPVIFHRRVRY
jgi:hypothetical protein